MVRSPNGITDFFEIVTGILQGETLASYMFIICQDYALQKFIDLMKGNGFLLKKTRSGQYPTETMTDTDYTNDNMVLTNKPTQGKFLLHSLEQAAGGISHYMNVF